eukprot:TRINITY_DN1330_c0_g2_i2.p1 TRINITY_DN1330_c0_g2~~TRINITY_DN1330_c0_g2_i2.p1  ORF type:complete len:354 (-),score=88.57 TRINITY_DN1330_c0_g2_i2:65-1126(-)
MPELPTVEMIRRRLHGSAVGEVISSVLTTEDEIVFKDITHSEFANRITGKQITATYRKGKYIWLTTDDEKANISFHLGMTGALLYKSDWENNVEQPIEYDGVEPTTQWPPEKYKFVLQFSNEEEIAYVCTRRLGRILLFDSDPEKSKPINTMGFDPLLDMPTSEEFYESLHKRKCPIKSLLLNPKFSAGVGNWIADETLYQAQVHPQRYAQTINEEESERIRVALQEVVRTAVDRDAKLENYPDTWIVHCDTKKEYSIVGGNRIEHMIVGGRRATYCPDIQILDDVSMREIKKLKRQAKNRRKRKREEKKKSKRKKRKRSSSRKRKKRKRSRVSTTSSTESSYTSFSDEEYSE